MLSDARRVEPFARAISALCKDKIVFESGTGTGILSILAARAGAKKVFCTELDSRVAASAKANIRASGMSEHITLIERSTLEVNLSDLEGMRPDVIMAENLSTWQVMEPQNEVMNHARSALAHAHTISIPARATNKVELCESAYRFMDAVELRTHYFEFTGIPRPTVRSNAATFSVFDYSASSGTVFNNEIAIKVMSSGVVNSLRLTSPLDVGPGITFEASDSLMPPVVVPLPCDLGVNAGDTVSVRVRYKTNTQWESFECEAELVS